MDEVVPISSERYLERSDRLHIMLRDRRFRREVIFIKYDTIDYNPRGIATVVIISRGERQINIGDFANRQLET